MWKSRYLKFSIVAKFLSYVNKNEIGYIDRIKLEQKFT